MSGQGVRFQAAGYSIPKPLIPIHGKPLIERLLEVFPKHWPRTFVVAENHLDTDLPKTLLRLAPTGRVLAIAPHKEGPGRALLAALPMLDPYAPVLVSYCDYGMVWDAEAFEEMATRSACDAAVLTYRGFHPHYMDRDPYAYCRMDGERVAEVREKGSFTEDYRSEHASSGAYYFRSAQLLKEGLDEQYATGLSINGEYYTSLTVQALLAKNPDSDVRVFEIEKFFQWGTPRHLRQYEYWERVFSAKQKWVQSPFLKTEQFLMPMAGLGSRFAQLTDTPKPLIEVGRKPMYRQASRAFERAEQSVFVTKAELKARFAPADSEAWVFLDETPKGQALSTQAGISRLDPAKSVVVTACDHEIVLDPARFQRFLSGDADAAIFTVKGFPHADFKPASYAYVRSESQDESEFPKVAEVSVKRAISNTPSQDALLTGTFWFRSTEILDKAIDELKKSDRSVNGELYLDSVFELMLERGLVVREIPLDGYICWGDPDALAESVYWEEVFLEGASK